DLAVAEHREHHSGVCGRDRRTEQASRGPAEAERPVREDCDAAGGGERAEDAERRDRDQRAAEAPPADPEAAVEKDPDQRHGRHLHDRLRRDVEAGEDVRCDRRGDEARSRERNREPLGELGREERHGDGARDEQDPGAEDGDVVHSQTPYFSVIQGILQEEILHLPMRKLGLVLLAGLLLLPAVAFADRGGPSGGSLVVTDANARLTVSGHGLIFGHLGRGTITVVGDYKPDDNTALSSVSGAKMKFTGGNVVYTGSDVRFLFPGGKY